MVYNLLIYLHWHLWAAKFAGYLFRVFSVLRYHISSPLGLAQRWSHAPSTTPLHLVATCSWASLGLIAPSEVLSSKFVSLSLKLGVCSTSLHLAPDAASSYFGSGLGSLFLKHVSFDKVIKSHVFVILLVGIHYSLQLFK